MHRREVIFIGGAPLSGKSTLASELSKKLAIPWVSTDDIRNWMQAVSKKEDYPGLFDGHGLDAKAFYKRFKTAQEVFEQQRKQSLDVQKGVTALIDSFGWRGTFIVEGIAIMPSYVDQLQKASSHTIQAIFLVDRDPENIKERLHKRGLWDKADTYPEYIKPIELEWTIMFNRHYEQETQLYNFALHDITELDSIEHQVMDYL